MPSCYPPADRSRRDAAPSRLFPLIRHLSYRLTLRLAATPLTPNQITGMSLTAGLVGAACFAFGTWEAQLIGGVMLTLSYTLDNCDGEIARMKGLSSAWGAKFDDLADWLVGSAIFAGLGYGTSVVRNDPLWLWLGLAATAGAAIDYLVRLVIHAKAAGAQGPPRKEEPPNERKPQDAIDWLIYVFHKLSRNDFCFIVLALVLFDIAWVLLPAAAVGAQAYWIVDLFPRARGWHV